MIATPGPHPDDEDGASATCLNCGELLFTNYRGVHFPEYRHARLWRVECPKNPDPDHQIGGKLYTFADRIAEHGRVWKDQ